MTRDIAADFGNEYISLKDLEKHTIFAVIDIGGNSISLELRRADAPTKKPKNLPAQIEPKYKNMCGLAQSIGRDGTIDNAAKACALDTLKEFKQILDTLQYKGYNVEKRVIGTAPFRDASNGAAFAEEIRREVGLDLIVIDGDTEARYAAQGVLTHFPGISGMTCDVGGGSAEFAVIENGAIKDTISLPLGMQRIAAYETETEKRDFINAQLEKLPQHFLQQDTLFTTGGANRNMAKAYARLHKINIKKCDKDCYVESKAFLQVSRALSETPIEDLENAFRMKSARAAQVSDIDLLLKAVQERAQTRHMVLNIATMRDGIRSEMQREGRGEIATTPAMTATTTQHPANIR